MQTQRSQFLPLALIVLAVAIVTAGVLISTSINAAAAINAHAQQTTAAVTGTSFLANEDARLAAQQASLNAQHQANLQSLQNQGPSGLDRLTAANQAAMTGR